LGERPHLIDEWQMIPRVRDAVRRDIDKSGSLAGQFILTGSSAPPKEQYMHSGAGRIAHLQMRPMSLFEQGCSSGAVSLQGLYDGDFQPGKAETGLEAHAEWICRGGWPASLGLPLEKALLIPDQYWQAIYKDNAPRDKKDPDTTRRIVASLAKNTGSAVKLETVRTDVFADGAEPDAKLARNTTKSYIDYLLSLYLIEELRGWGAPIKDRARLRNKPKRYFVDPSLAASALSLNPERLLREGQVFGVLFENLCLRDLRVYASAWAGPGQPELFYYRDDKGLEVDVVIEMADGRWGAIEIKLGENKADEGAASLLALQKTATQNPYARQLEPAFLMVLVGNGAFAHRRPDGVYVVPLTMLGA
ncbi:MAG: ATP-binding protein, partial [Coriobacteriia bacterium]|nr:ATP-binding protein [Coriobacteriia bacterium]